MWDVVDDVDDGARVEFFRPEDRRVVVERNGTAKEKPGRRVRVGRRSHRKNGERDLHRRK